MLNTACRQMETGTPSAWTNRLISWEFCLSAGSDCACPFMPKAYELARQRGERAERCDEAGALARGERLAQQQEAEEGGHHEAHLRDRHDHARLPALQALREEDEGGHEQ